MAISKKKVWPDRFPHVQTPIKYLTENGFTIVRVCDLDPTVTNSPSNCSFLVQRDDQSEHEIHLSFDPILVGELRIKRQFPLPDGSVFWLVCAESCLANYLWECDQLPPNDFLAIEQLSPDELMLALHWRDRD